MEWNEIKDYPEIVIIDKNGDAVLTSGEYKGWKVWEVAVSQNRGYLFWLLAEAAIGSESKKQIKKTLFGW